MIEWKLEGDWCRGGGGKESLIKNWNGMRPDIWIRTI